MLALFCTTRRDRVGHRYSILLPWYPLNLKLFTMALFDRFGAGGHPKAAAASVRLHSEDPETEARELIDGLVETICKEQVGNVRVDASRREQASTRHANATVKRLFLLERRKAAVAVVFCEGKRRPALEHSADEGSLSVVKLRCLLGRTWCSSRMVQCFRQRASLAQGGQARGKKGRKSNGSTVVRYCSGREAVPSPIPNLRSFSLSNMALVQRRCFFNAVVSCVSFFPFERACCTNVLPAQPLVSHVH